MCQGTVGHTNRGGGGVIRFGTYNIWIGRNGGITSSLRGMAQSNLYLVLFQETKITNRVHKRKSAGYRVLAPDAPNRYRRGGVGGGGGGLLLYRSPL